jgi:hypothetical protein
MMVIGFHVVLDRTNQGALSVARARLHLCFRADTRLTSLVPSQLLQTLSDGRPRATFHGESGHPSSFAGLPAMSQPEDALFARPSGQHLPKVRPITCFRIFRNRQSVRVS